MAQVPCDPLVYYNESGQELVYTHPVPTPWFAIRMTANWVGKIDTAYIGLGIDRASTSGSRPDTLHVRVLANQLPTYNILDDYSVLLAPNLNGEIVDAMYIIEFKYGDPVAWINPPDDFYLTWRIRGPANDIARIRMVQQGVNPDRSLIINQDNSTTLATDFMRTQLQLGAADSIDFMTKVHACWPYGYPVELTSFAARSYNAGVLLEWHTATEENNSGFIVERLLGSSEQGMLSLWQQIGFIEGHGTTNQGKSYSYNDPNASIAADVSGVVRYRLRQVDYDGKTELSPIAEVTLTQEFSFELEQSYPNPVRSATGSAAVTYSLPTEQQARLELFDALGRSVAVVAEGHHPAGRYSAVLPVQGLRSGVYFYRLTANGQTLTRRLSVIE
ncbi:MAG: T9SS type A sorting domain-containing protein [Bacteroidetes bacterium]|nr:T9SS type A sorting domain-containing protein [Bacteroidota bacterium]